MLRQLATAGKKALGRSRSRRFGATSWGCRPLQLESLESRDLLSVTFSVTNTDDSGPGSLRQAILDANANANGATVDRIEFNIVGAGVHTIQPLSALPTISDPVVIDGYTQLGSSQNSLATGSNAVLQIELDGSLAGLVDGLAITTGQSTVQGLVINRFAGNGISITVGDGNVVQGNFIGTDATGTVDLGNVAYGVLVGNGSQRDRIGTDSDGVNDAAERNVISGNGASGVKIDGFAKTDLNSPDTPANTLPTALDTYVAAPDASFSYTLMNTISELGYTAYIYDLTSQSWNPDGAVLNGRTEWHHWMQVIVPTLLNTSSPTAMMYLDGGSNTSTVPTSADSTMAQAAMLTGSIVVSLRQIPNEPLQFADEPFNHSEDQLIAYSFAKYLETGNATWAAYLPMVKSVIRAMDAVQAVVPGLTDNDVEIDNFILAGGSKRGWTTQLATAVDPQARVIGMVPAVSDLPNLAKQMEYHQEFYEGTTAHMYEGYSETMADYINYQAFSNFDTVRGQELLQIVDPYAYRNRATLDVPKYYLNGADDQFFVPGSAEFYIHEMQNHGPTFLRYTPNAGHGLTEGALLGGIEFAAAVAYGYSLPSYDWTIEDGGNTIRLTTEDLPVSVKLWQASNPDNRDYRQYESTPEWTSTNLLPTDLGFDEYVAQVDTPATGSTAFFIEVQYLCGTTLLTFSTSVSVVSADDSDVVQGNYIGTNAAGTAALGNDGDAVLVVDATHTQIANNVLSANGGSGVNIQGTDALATSVLSNYIGTDASGTVSLLNVGTGVLLQRGTPSSRITVLQQQGNNLALNGTSGNDTFALSQHVLDGHLGMVLNGGDLGTFPVSSLGSLQVNADGGTDLVVVNGRATDDTIAVNGTTVLIDGTSIAANDVESRQLNGGGGTDTLIGENVATTWQITGSGAGVLTGSLAFQQIENLVGGPENDIFQVAANGSLAGSINGGGGMNVLDYSYYPATLLGDGVDVDLRDGSATAISGGVSNISVLVGTSGSDVLHGGEANEILLGGGGIDTLLAAGGRDLVFGGTGADIIHTGNGDDIVIAGTTSYYSESSKALDLAALAAIMAEWMRTDIGYSTRVSHLLNGGGLNGSYRINSSTVSRDSALDLLYGEGGRDWFLGGSPDIAMDRVLLGSGAETWTSV